MSFCAFFFVCYEFQKYFTKGEKNSLILGIIHLDFPQ